MPSTPAELDLIRRIRRGDESAWRECIERYEGRLLAFARSRLHDASLAEDVVQDTFLGFLNALPNYDEQTPLDAFLFSITAHKLTDHLRKVGRRPALYALQAGDSPGQATPEPQGPQRRASSLARSREQRDSEELFIARTLGDLIREWRTCGEWERLQCVELLFVRGLPNKEVAVALGLSEQTVANHKYFVVNKLKAAADKARISDWDPQRLGLE